MSDVMNKETGILAGKIAFVTGSSRGIGRGIAYALAEAGATVIVTGRQEEIVRAIAEDLNASGKAAKYLVADLADDSEVDNLVPAAIALYGSIDILVNNAGIDGDHTVVGYPLDLWRDVLRLNLEVPFRLCQAIGPHFLERKSGVVINISSVQGTVGVRENCAYASSKHGVLGLTKVLADEWASEGVRVNAIAPGLIDTDMVKYLTTSPKFQDWLDLKVPARRVGTPKEIGDAAVFLASDSASYIHGISLPVDGGYLAS